MSKIEGMEDKDWNDWANFLRKIKPMNDDEVTAFVLKFSAQAQHFKSTKDLGGNHGG